MTTRREFLERAALLAAAGKPSILLSNQADVAASTPPAGFLDLQRAPDAVMAQTTTGDRQLTRLAGGRWTNAGIVVTAVERSGAVRVDLSAPAVAVKRLHLRWRGALTATRLILGDAWERGYGDLEWRGWVPDRVMPWYVATYDGSRTHAYGVRTGARALCFWQVDPEGISLWADVRSGGVGVQLGDRVLEVCDVVCRAGPRRRIGLRRHSRVLSPDVLQRAAPGAAPSTEVTTGIGPTERTAPTPCWPTRSTSSSSRHRAGIGPFAVIDDGWQPVRGNDKLGVGTWDRGNEKFPDMPALAADVHRAGARPGNLDSSIAGPTRRARRMAPVARPAPFSTRRCATLRRRFPATSLGSGSGASSSSSTTIRRTTSSADGAFKWRPR